MTGFSTRPSRAATAALLLEEAADPGNDFTRGPAAARAAAEPVAASGA